jgi:DNA-directed RNA polymerase specialized sigma24 family protein
MDTRGGGSSVTTVEDRWTADDLEALRAQYVPLRRFAAVIGRWDVEPDDLVQEAFAKVLAKQPAQIRELGPYLRRMVVNLATDERRRFGRAASAAPKIATDGASCDAYPSDLSDLFSLQPRVRALLYMVEVEGQQIAPAAEAVGMSSGNARVALLRARRRLRAELSKESSGE